MQNALAAIDDDANIGTEIGRKVFVVVPGFKGMVQAGFFDVLVRGIVDPILGDIHGITSSCFD
jgi:hypothetical protein